MIGDLQGFGIVSLNPQSIANIHSLAEVVKTEGLSLTVKKVTSSEFLEEASSDYISPKSEGTIFLRYQIST